MRMSGLTTTGSTVIRDLDSLPLSLNLWRHMLNWIGGMGIIVLAVAIDLGHVVVPMFERVQKASLHGATNS